MLFDEQEIILPEPRGWQKKALPVLLQQIDNKTNTLLCVPTGCHAKGTKILSFTGEWLNVEDVKVGDLLMGDDNTPREVLDLYRGQEKMYKIIPVKGESFIVNESHILSLKHYKSTGRTKKWSVETINLSVKEYLLKSNTYKHCSKLYRPKNIYFNSNYIPYSYCLGVFIGDGALTQGNIAIHGVKQNKKDAFLPKLSEFAENFDTIVSCKYYQSRDCYNLHILGDKIKIEFNNLGLLGCYSKDKFIPKQYLLANRQTKLELLAGLLDTDGSLSSNCCFEYSTASKQLANDIKFLCQSIGIACYISEKKVNNYPDNIYYRLSLSGDFTDVPLILKQTESRKQIKDVTITGFTVEPLGIDNYYGFELDQNHLYVMQDYFVTHNTGKTKMALMVIANYIKQHKRALFVVDRLVLIQQTKETVEECGIRCDILQGNNSTYTDAPVVIASQQTLVRRNFPKHMHVMFIDECHIMSKALKDIVKEQKIATIGLSATPFTKGLGLVFKTLYNPYTTEEATSDKVLVPLRVKECKAIDMAGAKKIGGEYSDHDVEERGMNIVGDVVTEYKNHANNKAIAFCATIKQSMALADEFNSRGIPAAVFCATTTAEERKEILKSYAGGTGIMVLVSVAALATGFDAPNVRTVLDCRPLSRSLSTYIQSIGRGLRSMQGKSDCLLLDFTGNMRHFATDFVDFYLNGLSSLDDGVKKDRVRKDEEKKDKKESKGCPECQSKLWVLANNTWNCLACGYVVEQEKEVFDTQKVDYEVKELDIFAAAKKGETNKALWTELSNYVYKWHEHPNYDKDRALKRAIAMYKQMTNVFPKWGQKLSPSKDGFISQEVQNKITQMNIAYQRSKRIIK